MNKQITRTYYRPDADSLLNVEDDNPAPALVQFVHRQFRALVSEAEFPCVGARAAFRARTYRFGLYEHLASPEGTHLLARHLCDFATYRRELVGDFNTFVAVFREPPPTDEMHFEVLLWTQLQQLHGLDSEAWDPAVSSDPEDARFEFSFAGHAFFVVGLHAASSRWSRRFGWPTLVFNGHDQFQKLRLNGKMNRFQKTIRGRDAALQGDLNPNLEDFGNKSDARQYSGRPGDDSWSCPFKQRRAIQGENDVSEYAS